MGMSGDKISVRAHDRVGTGGVKAHRRRLSVAPHGLRPVKGPGKYEGELLLTKFIHQSGFFDDELGDVDTFGYYGLVRLGPSAVSSIEGELDEDEVLTQEEIDLVRSSAGVILSEDPSGFVYAEYYDSKEKMDVDWKKLEKEYQQEIEETDEDG